MRRLLLLLVLLAGAPAPARTRPPEKIVVITNVNIVDVESGALIPRVAVVIRKGRIFAIAKRALIQESPQIVIVNGEGKYLIPGLWDMRVHLLLGSDEAYVRDHGFPLLIANGVTGVRDVDGDVTALKPLQAEVAAGTLVGPRIVLARPAPDDPAAAVHDPEQARAAVQARSQRPPGVGLLAGSDSPAGAAPGFALHRELRWLVEAGLTPLQALQAATLDPARFLGREKEMGTVEKGKLADLVLLDDDPTRDIGNLDKIAGVVVAGRYFSRRDLDDMLARAEAPKETK